MRRRCEGLFGAVLLVIGFATIPIGCASDPADGWSMSWTHPDRYRSVSIPMFQNLTLFRGLETELTRALVVEMEAATPYKVTGPGTADTLLRGKIVSVELISLSKGLETGLSDEMLFKASINFEWIDLATGEAIVSRENFTASALFVPSRPVQETIDLGRFGVVQQLATDLVDAMREDW